MRFHPLPPPLTKLKMSEATASTSEQRTMTIVAAVDESEESIYALQWSLGNLIGDDDGHHILVLVHVQPQLPVYSMYGSGYLFSDVEVSSMRQHIRDLADSVLEKAQNICRSYYSNIKVEAKTCTGDAGHAICDLVEKLRADVLVMGNHGYGFVKRALLGSVSEYCARNAKCPVVIVKRPT